MFGICSVYAPNIPQIDPSVPTILAGDFNAVFDRLLDRVDSSPDDTSRESSVALRRLFDSCCVEDVWRYLHPSSSSFSWARWDHSCASHIGFLLLLPVILCLSLFLTIVPCWCLFLSLRWSLVARPLEAQCIRPGR